LNQSQWRTDMLMLDRRTLLRAGSAAVGGAALAPAAFAHAPQAGTQAQPSFYRFKLGTIEITVVSDGTLAFPAETLWGDRAEDARGLLTSTFQPARPVGLQLNTILVNAGDKLVLIDAGCGVDKFQKTSGALLRNLAAAGYAPGDIDTILFTHFHFDHLWGISDHENAALLFPSAEFIASETELAFWSASDLADKLPPAQQPRVTQANLKLATPRLRPIKAVAEVVPGVTTFATPGHTPGHISVHIGSGSEELLLTGDVVLNSAVSFLHPEWPFGFDIDVPLELLSQRPKSTLFRPSVVFLAMHLHCGGHTLDQPHAIRHLIDVDAHWHALGKSHPGEDRVHRGEPRLIRLRVGNVDAAGDTADMAMNDLAVAHQLDLGRVAVMDRADTGLLEITVNPEGIHVDDRDLILPNIGVVPPLHEQIGHIAVHRRANACPLQINMRVGQVRDRLLIDRFCSLGVAGVGLLLLLGRLEVGQLGAAAGFPRGIGRIGPRLCDGGLGPADNNCVVGRIDHHEQIALVHKLIVGNW
jgi:glyoxylase-like metal-dependent hydrolase (beta-lactamase superfamily II)